MLVREGSQLRRAKIADYLRLGVVMMKKKVVKLRNQFARDLRTPKYRKRVVSSKKTYTRKVKHK
jgi:hypothetical protein